MISAPSTRVPMSVADPLNAYRAFRAALSMAVDGHFRLLA